MFVGVFSIDKSSLFYHYAVSTDPPDAPCLLSTNSEVVIAPKTRKPVERQAVNTTSNKPSSNSTLVRVLPLEHFSELLALPLTDPRHIWLSPSNFEKLQLKDGQKVFLRYVFPPIDNLIEHVKHLSSPLVETQPKEIALGKLKASRSGESTEENKPAKTDEMDHYLAHSYSGLPHNQAVMVGHPTIIPWDIVR